MAVPKSYYKGEGIDLEIVLMPTHVINTAALTRQIDINGAVDWLCVQTIKGSEALTAAEKADLLGKMPDVFTN